MPVVGACAADGADSVVRQLLPSATRRLHWPEVAVAATADVEIRENAIRVGHAPTASTMVATSAELILQRGAAWTAPVYYRTDEQVASSDVRLLVRPGDVPDRERVAALVGNAVYRHEQRCWYTNIRTVRPFETVVLSRQGRSATQSACPKAIVSPTNSIEEIALELRRLFLAAVSRVVGNRQVAITVGGLDSSSLLGALIALRGSKKDAYVTIDVDAPSTDRPYVRTLEKYFGITVIRVKTSDARGASPLIIDAGPTSNIAASVAVLCAQRAHEAGAEMLLHGVGGDLIFGGAVGLGMATTIAVAEGDWCGAWDAFRATLPYRFGWRARGRAVAIALLRSNIPDAVRQLRKHCQLHRQTPSWAGPVMRNELLHAHARQRFVDHRDPQARFEAIADSANEALFAAGMAQVGSILPIPSISPLYDEDLVRFLTSLPPQKLFTGGSFRGLLRRAMRGMLPELVRMRFDKAAAEPGLADAIPFAPVESMLSFTSLERAGIVNARALREHLAPLFTAPRDSKNGLRWVDFALAVPAEAFLRANQQ